jgi:hypothetical protein
MAYRTIARFPGDPDVLLEAYRRSAEVMSGVGRDYGLVLHAAAKADDGLVVINLWPSRDESEAAARDPRRLGALADAPIDPSRIEREHLELESYELFS